MMVNIVCLRLIQEELNNNNFQIKSFLDTVRL